MTLRLDYLGNLPIRRKLTLVILLTCGSVLVLASVALFVFQSITAKAQAIREISALGRMIAHNSAAAAAFSDREGAVRILSLLEDRADVEGACLVLADGQHVTQLDRDEEHDSALEESLAEGYHFEGPDLLFATPVMLDGKQMGTLYLRADLRPAQSNLLNRYLKTLAVMLVVTLLLAFALASRFQRLITAPILHLAGVVKRVAKNGNYSLQATKAGNDEVGALTEAFNAMLDQIRTRDNALQEAREGLEERVKLRTAELHDSISILNATLESTADGILAVHRSGKVVSFNAQFTSMWSIPFEVMEKRDTAGIDALMTMQLKDSNLSEARIKEQPLALSSEPFSTLELSDGRTFERYVKPQWIEGKSVGLVINFRDITERRRAEIELETVHKQLMETSRQAGMAEVATSVLHNVGNVLNSVNVSCSVIAKKVKNSRIGGVTKTAELLREHTDNLAQFLTSDPTGQKLPAYLFRLAARLSEEQRVIIEELQLLSQNIEHIKEIVAVQQNYAKNIGGVRETLPIEGLIEDALRINENLMNVSRIQLVRDYVDIGPVSLEKHKVLQILVNLVSNAAHALNGCQLPRLALGIARTESHAAVSVSDNGVGISRENIDRIFAHGFTTKETGHGFGLHSSVLAAQQMGGSLRVHSDGLGKGATFTLHLPLAFNPKK